ncbi:hypothetical protein D9M72_607810 [compost metagenome]
MVAPALQCPAERQHQHHSQQHAVTHFPGAGGADEKAVEQVAPDGNQRQYGEVGQVDERGVAHTLNVGLHFDEQMPGEQKQRGKAQAREQRPAARHHQ